MIGRSLAVRYPSSLRRLVLLATAPGDGKGAAPYPDALKALTGPTSDVNVLLGLLFPPDQTVARDRYVADILMRKPFEAIAPAAVAASQSSASGAWLTGQDADGTRVAKLRLPVLVGGGEQDHLLPFANQLHLAAMISGAALISYADASHGFFVQHADDFLPRLNAFIA
jgi:pimeloyl-ACP methyl ester carboxylesterase